MRHRVYIVCIALCRSFSRKSLPPREKVKFWGATRGSKIKTRLRRVARVSSAAAPSQCSSTHTRRNTDCDAS